MLTNHGESIVMRISGKEWLQEPSDLNTIDTLTNLLISEIELRVASEQDIEAALNKYYGGSVDADTPLIRLVNQIIVEVFKMRASDIHVEPLYKGFRLRYRINGVMQSKVGNTCACPACRRITTKAS